MPYYEYRCLKCGTITEILRPIKSRDEATNCSGCGASTKRVLSIFNTGGLPATQKKKENSTIARSGKAQGTGVRIEGGTATFKDCSFQNLQTGISVAKGSKLNMDGSRFIKVNKPFEITDE